jgi:small subunit ribosomal protein S2
MLTLKSKREIAIMKEAGRIVELAHIAVQEAKRLGIPTVGIVDTNSNPEDVDVAIPANDDASGSVKLILSALTDAILEAKGGVVLHDLTATDEEVSMESVVTGDIVKEEAKPAEKKVSKKRVEKKDESANA